MGRLFVQVNPSPRLERGSEGTAGGDRRVEVSADDHWAAANFTADFKGSSNEVLTSMLSSSIFGGMPIDADQGKGRPPEYVVTRREKSASDVQT